MTADMDGFEARRASSLAALRSRVRESQPSSSGFGWVRLALPAVAIAAAALVVVVTRPVKETASPPAVTPRPGAGPMFKGTLGLQVYARRAERQFSVRQGTQLTCGDELRFAVTTATAGYVTVFSLDGRDRLTPFYPSSSPDKEPRPLRVHRGGRQLLPGGITLDDAVGGEQIVVVFASREFDRRQVHRRAAKLLRRSDSRALSARAVGVSGEVEVLDVRKLPCAE
jgi:hypothetical protein